MKKQVIEDLQEDFFSQFQFATGFIRPKTTALFFDKLWAPDEIRKTHYGRVYGMYDMPESVCISENDVCDQDLFNDLESRLAPIVYKMSKSDRKSPVDSLEGFRNMLLSENRNKGIILGTSVLNQYFGINIVPILVDKTRYELDIERHNKKTQRFDSDSNSQPNNIWELTIHALPSVIEEKLTWNQVLEFRKDKKSVGKLRRFLSWANVNFQGKSKSQIQDEIGRALDDYKYTLKKHGIETTISGFTTVLSSTSTVLGAINDIQSAGTVAGIAISIGLLTYYSANEIERMTIERSPIAYIYDVINETDKWWAKR